MRMPPADEREAEIEGGMGPPRNEQPRLNTANSTIAPCAYSTSQLSCVTYSDVSSGAP